MLHLIWTLSVHTHDFLRRYMPTNRLLDAIRTRRGLKWGVPAMLLAIPYLIAAVILRDRTESGGPGWLNLIVLLCIWNSMKLTIMGSVSVVLLLRVKARKHVERGSTCVSAQAVRRRSGWGRCLAESDAMGGTPMSVVAATVGDNDQTPSRGVRQQAPVDYP